MVERRFKGKSASPGLAIGALVFVDQDLEAGERRRGSPEEERTALQKAIAKAMSDLEALADVASGDGADILAFQIEMLSDPALVEDALPLIDGGQDAASAWKTGLDRQLAIYATADDDYFKARASDLEDLQDRVLRVLRGLSIDLPDMPAGAILVARDLPPSRFLSIDAEKLGGLVLIEGNATSHVAILVRGRGLPMIVDLEAGIETDAEAGGAAIEGILDAGEGVLLIDPAPKTRKRYETKRRRSIEAAAEAAALRDRPAVTADGQTISVLVNIDDPTAIDDALLAASDGVGLLRTEFLLIGRRDLPDEDEHFQTYADLQRRLAGKQLIIRTLDIGGDKPLPGLDVPKEGNSFLGLRGIRLCLDHLDLFKPQVRALLRVTACGPLQVMLPMVAVQAEIDETRHLFADCLEELHREGVAAAMPDIGIMVETPASAIAADQLDAAHFSIGSNDLVQYTMAAARDGTGRVAALQDPQHPAIERLIKMVVDHGAAAGKDVSVCGNMASEPACLPLLLRVGMRKISVLPGMFDQVKATIATIDLGAEDERA